MTVIARIDDEEVSAEEFIKILKLTGKFDSLIEDVMTDKLTVHVAKKQGITVSIEEVQERVDELRRIRGLHRTKDTLEFLENMGVTLEDFEKSITEGLYKEKMLAALFTDDRIKEYFRLHLPRFDSVEISHIVLDSEGKVNEIMACLEDDPDLFPELAREHTLDPDTRESGGVIGKIMRGALSGAIEAKIFNAAKGQVVGPFVSENGLLFEIFMVTDKHAAKLDASTVKDAQKLLYDEWLEARAREHSLEVL
jgi:Parvulin-like peptidyl-prolyl isomerase